MAVSSSGPVLLSEMAPTKPPAPASIAALQGSANAVADQSVRAAHPTSAFTTQSVEFEATKGWPTGEDAFTDSK